ncbi:MAG: YfhO family protein [Acidobacteriota bacterium]
MRPRIGIPAAGFLLAALAAAAFWPVVAGSRNFFHLDLRYEHLPVWDVTQRALLRGDSPFWIDGEYCGHPLLFHQEAPVFYPPTVPLLLTGAPVERLADLFSLFHFWLAGFGAYLLLRELDADGFSALFGAVAWMLSARLVQSAIWPNAVAVEALLPPLLLGVFRIARGRSRSGALIAAVSGGLAILAARPHVLLGAAPILAAVAAAAAFLSARRARAAFGLAVSAVLALALGGASLLPSAALYPEMSRAGGLSREERDVNPISVEEGLDLVFLPVDGAPRWPEAAAYPGAAAGLLFLAGIALLLSRRLDFSRPLFLALLTGGVVGLVFAFGERGPYRYVAGLPLIRGFRVPARYLVSWSLAVALGSALTLSAILRRIRRASAVGAALVLLVAGDLVWHARRAAPTAPAGLASARPAILSPLSRALGIDEAGFPRRFWSLAPPINLLAYADREKALVARVAEPLSGALAMRYGLASVSGGGPPLQATRRLFVPPSARSAELAGVGAVVIARPRQSGPASAAPPALEVRRLSALPRALLVSETVAAPGDAGFAAALSPGFDPRRAAVVEGGGPPLAGGSEPRGDVRLLSRRPSSLELSTRAPGERVLVLFDAYERGWTARVDGRPAEVFRADAAFRGVRVPAGDHRVAFEYRPPGLREGIGLSAAGALGLILIARRADSAARRTPPPAKC